MLGAMITLGIFKKMVKPGQAWVMTNHLTRSSGPRKILKVEERRVLFEDAKGFMSWVFFPDPDNFIATGVDSFDMVTGQYAARKKILSFKLLEQR